ncbi:ESX secretion-associated protein EspG [Gordonia otitidis]|uniref:ESX secretion-associated protein EspG n=1 Tax=Gordonia otitidis TaxID=249058 RepID=UPI001D1570A8|nr:ESX secretion-associated protein EspG [Gordonia otitidis]UEA58180.1 ESX secretion-associated protein EspG [Gordonia otitidis]
MIWTAARGGQVEVATLRRVGARLGVACWPVVLDMLEVDDDAYRASRTDAAADVRIAELGIIDDVDDPVPWLAAALRVLGCPDHELEIRTFTESGTIRACLATCGDEHVFAVRIDDTVEISVVELRDVADVCAVVRKHCTRMADNGSVDSESRPSAALRFAALACPCDELADRLGRCRRTDDVTHALTRLGMSSADAGTVARALSDVVRRTEIVAVSHRDGLHTQSPGALGIIDTSRGRIVAGPSRSPDGRVWTTLSPGSGHRIGQAVGLLIETLPDGAWFR